MAEPLAQPSPPPKWAKVIDHEACIGCHACTTACKSENEVPLGVTRTYVKYVEVGAFPLTRRHFQVTRCNQCDDAPCAHACPTSAMYRRPDGIVDFDKSICIGCKACIAACPYDAIFINPEDRSAEKCNFCAQRLDVGLEPACVVVCPAEAILVGDLNDPRSKVSQIVHREPVAVRRPEKETLPKLFYRGAHQATLDPLAARRPPGGLFLWSEQIRVGDHVVSGHPAPSPANSSAAALLAYDVPHRAPWDWRVSLYTLTKGIAAGSYLMALLALLTGCIGTTGPMWLWAAPVLGGLFLAATGAVLIADLEHPERFWMIFTRPQWRSWLVRGAFLITGYGAVLVVHFLLARAGLAGSLRGLAWLGAPLAAATAIYTAYLFAQAKARDLWQSPLLPIHLLAQCLLAGAATLLPLATRLEPAAVPHLNLWLFGFSAAHLLCVAGEVTLTHGTAHTRLAIDEMVWGRYRTWFWVGVVGVGIGLAAPVVGWPAGLAALTGLAAYEHAYVQAGQSVPLA